jgi:hypothetical protein
MEKAVPAWLRIFFFVNVLQDLALGSGLIVPESIPFPLAVTPLNARFIGALYLAAAVGMVLSALVRDRRDTRIIVISFGLVSVLVMIVTILYWADFTARRIPMLWLVTYTVDPIVTAALVVSWKLWHPAIPGRHALSRLLLAEFVLLGVMGHFSLLAPGPAVDLWPWKITPLLAQVYGAFLLTFAAGALLAAREARASAILPIVASSFALAVLVIVASAQHLPRFVPGAPTWIWFGGFTIAGIALGIGLFVLLRQGSRLERPAFAEAP